MIEDMKPFCEGVFDTLFQHMAKANVGKLRHHHFCRFFEEMRKQGTKLRVLQKNFSFIAKRDKMNWRSFGGFKSEELKRKDVSMLAIPQEKVIERNTVIAVVFDHKGKKEKEDENLKIHQKKKPFFILKPFSSWWKKKWGRALWKRIASRNSPEKKKKEPTFLIFSEIEK